MNTTIKTITIILTILLTGCSAYIDEYTAEDIRNCVETCEKAEMRYTDVKYGTIEGSRVRCYCNKIIEEKQ